MAFATARQLVIHSKTVQFQSPPQPHNIPTSLAFFPHDSPRHNFSVSGHRIFPVPIKASNGSVSTDTDEEGISLGTMKLSPDINIPKFEILLFQWGNSLNQGAQLPLPCAMKVDKIEGGIRLGFVSIDEGKAKVEVYIDCTVTSESSNGLIFRAVRKGIQKEKVAPGEPRIMKSLLAALKTSAQLAATA